MEHICTCARAAVPHFPYLRNCTDWAEIWYVVRNPLYRRFTEVDDGLHLPVRTCAPISRMSRMIERIAPKFPVRLWDQQQCVLYVLRVEHIARVHVRTHGRRRRGGETGRRVPPFQNFKGDVRPEIAGLKVFYRTYQEF